MWEIYHNSSPLTVAHPSHFTSPKKEGKEGSLEEFVRFRPENDNLCEKKQKRNSNDFPL